MLRRDGTPSLSVSSSLLLLWCLLLNGIMEDKVKEAEEETREDYESSSL